MEKYNYSEAEIYKIPDNFKENEFLLKRAIKLQMENYFTNNKDYLVNVFGARELASKTFPNGQEFSDTIYSSLESELKKRNLELSSIEGLEIKNGYLNIHISPIKGEKDIISFDLSASSAEKVLVKNQIENLKEELGKSVTDYAIGGSIFAITFLPSARYEVGLNSGSLSGFVKKIVFKNSSGEHSIEVNEAFKKEFSQIDLIKLLEKKGVEFNTKTNQFEFKSTIDAIKGASLEKALKDMTFKEYKENLKKAGVPEETIDKKGFEDFKKQGNEFIIKVSLEAKANTKSFGKVFLNMLEKVGGKSLHYVLLPIFFQELHKHSGSDASYIGSAVEVIGFMGGAKLGGIALLKAGVKHPLVLLAGSLLAGGTLTVAGHEGLKHYDKKILSYLPNKDIESKQKSIDSYLISFGWIYNTMDDLDFDFTENPYLDMSQNINLAEAPEVYLAKRFGGVKHWNEELEEYKAKTKERMKDLFSKDYKYSDILKDKDDLENIIYNLINTKSDSSKNTYSRKSKKSFDKETRKISKKLVNFIETNIPKNTFIGDTKNFIKFLESFETEIKTYNLDEKTKDILSHFRYHCEKDFIEKVDRISGEISFPLNDIQKKSYKKTRDIIYNQYYKSKTDLKIQDLDNRLGEDNHSSIGIDIKGDDNEKKSENEELAINLVLNEIDKNKIDKTYIEKYNESLDKKRELIDLALEGKLISLLEEEEKIQSELGKGKTIIISDYGKSIIIGENKKATKVDEDLSDLVYISSLSEKDRMFIKDIVFKRIMNNEKITSLETKSNNGYIESFDNKSTITINQNKNINDYKKFISLKENPKFYRFYKRMIAFSNSSSFIKNIEEKGDAVDWDIEKSHLYEPLKYINKKLNDIIIDFF